MNINRYCDNPIITHGTVLASRKDFEVIGAFNAGVTVFNGETILILRVAERPINSDDKSIMVPFLDDNLNLKVKTFNKNDENYDFSDSRAIHKKGNVAAFEYLTSISHFRLARSMDGEHFKVDEKPFIFPANKYESFGIEDPRVTKIDDSYYITYSAVSKFGIVVMLSSTDDFKTFENLGAIFATENKDVALFPEKINDNYYALNRPISPSIGNAVIWISESTNLLHWGNHKVLIETRDGKWDCKKIGAGSPPLKTDLGWLEFYHGVDDNDRYCMGALLLDINDPSKILARSSEPILEPIIEYETKGFFGNVVFSCGTIVNHGVIHMYYGVSDDSMAYAQFKLKDVLDSMEYLKPKK